MANSQNPTKAASKQINIYIRKHPFYMGSIDNCTTSQRRWFLRNVYDYSRALGLSRNDAKQQTIKAREMCGENEYDTAESAFENETDDSQAILASLAEPIIPATAPSAMPSQVTTALSHSTVSKKLSAPRIPINGLTASSKATTESRRKTAGPKPLPSVTSNQLHAHSQKSKRSASDIALDNKTAQLLTGTSIDSPPETVNPPKRRQIRPIASVPLPSSASKYNKRYTDEQDTSHSFHKDKSLRQHQTQVDSIQIQGNKTGFNTSHLGNLVPAKPSFELPATAIATPTAEDSTKSTQNFEPPDILSFSDDDEEV